MVMAEVKIKHWGNSLGLIIPMEIAKMEELNEGDTVKIEILKDKRVEGFGILKNAPSFQEDEEKHPEFW